MITTTPHQILQQIAEIQRMEPGKLCIIGQGPSGPYYSLQCREHGKPVSRYVPREQVEAVERHTANYKEFQQLVESYTESIVRQTREERAGDAKKKTRPASSASKRKNSKR